MLSCSRCAARLFMQWIFFEVHLGEMPEWSNGLAWKVSVSSTGHRGFESLSLRHNTCKTGGAQPLVQVP